MNAPTQNGRAVTEVATPPVVTSEGGIPTSDTAKDTPRYTWDQVEVGVKRFLHDFRERQALDAEWEFAEMCRTCRQYPSAMTGLCFSCGSRRPVC